MIFAERQGGETEITSKGGQIYTFYNQQFCEKGKPDPAMNLVGRAGKTPELLTVGRKLFDQPLLGNPGQP